MPTLIQRAVRTALKVPGLSRLVRTSHALAEAAKISTESVQSTSYFPGEPRKSRSRQLAENMWWAIKEGEPNYLYFSCGLDRANFDSTKFISQRYVIRRKRLHNLRGHDKKYYNYICLVRDKLIFYQLAEKLGYPTPELYAVAEDNELYWYVSGRKTTNIYGILDRDMEAFCKPVSGVKGIGIFSIASSGGSIYIDGRSATIDEFKKRINTRYLLQEIVKQHPELDRLHTKSVNSLRLVTVINGRKTIPVFAALRIGTGGQRINDVSYGITVSVDLAIGKLRGRGYYLPGQGTTVDRHPDTGIVLDGYPLPFFEEAVEQACRFHRDLRHIHSIGWDIVFAPKGPCFLEGNDNWNPRMHMFLERDFKERFLSFF